MKAAAQHNSKAQQQHALPAEQGLLSLPGAGTSGWISARRTVHSRSWSAERPVIASTSRDLMKRTITLKIGRHARSEVGYHART
jgi:hypothetical protein